MAVKDSALLTPPSSPPHACTHFLFPHPPDTLVKFDCFKFSVHIIMIVLALLTTESLKVIMTLFPFPP